MTRDQPDNLSERAIEMIHLVVDGEATATEAAEVQELLASSPQARAFHDSMVDLAKRIAAEPPAEPPPLLRDQVLSKLRHKAVAIPIAATNPARRQRRIAWLYAAAAIIVIGLALQPLLRQSDSDRIRPSQASGAMAPAQVNDWPVINETTSPEGDTLVVRRLQDQYAVQLRSAAAGTRSIEWDPQRMSLVTASPEASIANNTVTFISGTASTVILHSRGPEPTEVRARAANHIVMRISIQADR